jgi:hypothetical protein
MWVVHIRGDKMKQTVQMKIIQEKLQPGVITRDGFLGSDRRNLVDILEDDEARVKRIKLTHRQIADRMIELRDVGMKGLGDFISVPPHYEIRVDSVRGKLPCPFVDPGILPKTNITVRNLKKNAEIIFTDLHIHLIGSHGFYEGKGSIFRLEPATLADILEIKPEEE